ncbi:MAG: hypothetical protein RL375_493 [Pseudomonadota bacterium]|jgi:peptidoglycan L-alanyl-D-glutamate endopeptidase CwlK
MKTWRLSKRSYAALTGVRPELIVIVSRALWLSPVDLVVLEGLRTKERQAAMVASGASRTHRSRHLTGHAIDLGAIVDGVIRWDWPLYEHIAVAMKRSAEELKVPLEWGGDWSTFKDGPHFQLPWDSYP